MRRGNALSNVAFNLTRSVVPPIAGATVALVGNALAFGINAASFAVAAAAVSLMRSQPRRPAGGARAAALRQIAEGLHAAGSDEVIWLTLVMATVYALGYFGATLVAIPALAKFSLQAGNAGVGLLYGALGTGALVGAVVTGAVSRVPRTGLTGSVLIVATGSSMVLTALAPTLALVLVALVFAGAFGSATGIIFFSLLQTRSAPAVRGRIMALMTLSLASSQPLSYAVAGIGSDTLGPRGIVLAGGLCVAASGILGIARPAMRAVE